MSSETAQQHEAAAPATPLRCGIVTVSDTRTTDNDASGDCIQGHLEQAGHRAGHRTIVRDEPADIGGVLDTWLGEGDLDAVILTGGTGVSPRDRTLEAVLPRLDFELPGFGETFRRLSFDEIGPPAMLSRTVAGLCRKPQPVVLFALPGSRHAVDLAMGRLIVPILPHLLSHARPAD